MKTVYTVRGSEDGTIGVYSSMKKALKKARDYVEQNDSIEEEDLSNTWIKFITGQSCEAQVDRWDVE